jgi:hypothetical protein
MTGPHEVVWTNSDIETFNMYVREHGDDLRAISKRFIKKPHKEIVRYWYMKKG